jgi:L-amino acid N-acyltransferase YncA
MVWVARLHLHKSGRVGMHYKLGFEDLACNPQYYMEDKLAEQELDLLFLRGTAPEEN